MSNIPGQKVYLPSHQQGSNDAAPPEVPNTYKRRALFRPETAERIREGLKLAGASDAASSLFLHVQDHVSYLERCSIEADAVLDGNITAANRLWLLLQTSIPSLGILKGSPEIDPRDAISHVPPVIDGEVLFRLVAGVTRAANQPSEAELMLNVLGQLLHPLLTLDLANTAVERARNGDAEMLDTLVIAQGTPGWLAALTSGPTPAPILDAPVTRKKLVLNADRVPFETGSWLHPSIGSTVDNWGVYSPCAGGVHKSMSQIDRWGGRYQIDSISPADACAGQTLTIRGSGFGAVGRVTFPAPKAGDPTFALGLPEGVLIGVAPTRWTDTNIEVVVPTWATAGNLRLAAFTQHKDPCVTVDVYRLGNTAFFKGGLASVYQVSLDGSTVDLLSPDSISLPLGKSITLSWYTSGGPGSTVRVQVVTGSQVLVDRNNLPGGFGSLTFSVPITNPEIPAPGHLTLMATGPCGQTQPLDIPVWLSVPPRLTIEYIEVTQGVQTGLADVLAGRGMPTVANKDTAVRVHMQCDRGGWFFNQLDNITGALFVDGRKLPPKNTANIKGFSNANVTNDTLNFSIPAAWLTKGPHTLGVMVISNDRSGKLEVQRVIQWTWHAKDPLRVRVVHMGPGGSDAEMLTYAQNALEYLPTDLSNIGIASRRNYIHDNDLATRSSWSALRTKLEDAWDEADEEDGVRWIGYVPTSSVPANSPVSGISGVPSIAVLAIASAPQTGAHELGHSLGLNHVHFPLAGVPGGFSEPDGPYDSVANLGILERAGYDVRANRALPALAADTMSYFKPRAWSTTNWMRLFNGFGDR
jgi:hypothetical protein